MGSLAGHGHCSVQLGRVMASGFGSSPGGPVRRTAILAFMSISREDPTGLDTPVEIGPVPGGIAATPAVSSVDLAALTIGQWQCTAPVRSLLDLHQTGALASPGMEPAFVAWSALRQSGIVKADVLAWSAAVYEIGDTDFAGQFAAELFRLGARWPDLTVRAGIGWLLAAAEEMALGSFVGGRGRLDEIGVNFVGVWAHQGLLETGWVFASAGLSVHEASDRIKEGTLTCRDALVMAALRGVPLPTG